MSNPDLPSQLVFHGNGGTFPPYGTITSDDHGPVVVTFNWIFYCLTGLAVLARFATRRTWTADSFLLLAAWILLTGESVAVHRAASTGLGRRFATLDAEAYARYSKAFYASELLQIAALAVTKMSYVFIFKRLVSVSSDRMRHMVGIFHALLALFAAWGVATVFAFAFQCPLPNPWDAVHNSCPSRASLYYITGIINMATDLAIIAVPVIIVYNVRLKSYDRHTIVGIFATRILTVIATGVTLGYLGDYLWGPDSTWALESPTIWGQAMLNLSIITACVPLMKPFLDRLQFSLADASTLPFTAQAGLYNDAHPRGSSSPLWSREREKHHHSASGGSSSSGGDRSRQQQQQQQHQHQHQHEARTWRVAQTPPRASWKQSRKQRRHREPKRAQKQPQYPNQYHHQQMRYRQQLSHAPNAHFPDCPLSQVAPSLQPQLPPTGHSPHNSLQKESSMDYARPSDGMMGMGSVSDPRW